MWRIQYGIDLSDNVYVFSIKPTLSKASEIKASSAPHPVNTGIVIVDDGGLLFAGVHNYPVYPR